MKWNPLWLRWSEVFHLPAQGKKIYTTSHVKQNRKLISSDFIGLSFINRHKRCILSRGVAPKSNWEAFYTTALWVSQHQQIDTKILKKSNDIKTYVTVF